MNEEYLDPGDTVRFAWEEDAADGYQVIALDPGGTTGWALFEVHPDAMGPDPELPVLANLGFWTAGQFNGRQDSQIDEIVELVNSWPDAKLVTEDFKVRQMAVLLDPAEINAAVRWATRPRYWVRQQPDLAMSTVTDDRLKRWGFWLPGQQHARDAVKHGITFLKRKKEQAVKAGRVVSPEK